jgi:hypothetical protein
MMVQTRMAGSLQTIINPQLQEGHCHGSVAVAVSAAALMRYHLHLEK